MRKKLPVGIENFEKFKSENFYYVDKTMFISELLHHWGEVNLFTRPRRFGKSLNMSMLKCFFETGGDRSLFDGLKITREKELCEKYMGKFPVISISLKNVSGETFEEASVGLRSVIGDEASRFLFLQESNKLSEDEREAYRRLIHVDLSTEANYTMSDAALVSSLRTLSRLLSKHYDCKVILLIDEYDVPLDKAFQEGYYDRMVKRIGNMFSNALKTNDNLYFAVLTGCLRISKESIFTGLNNLKVHTISDFRYDEYFGFTDEDVDQLLEYYGLTEYKDIIRDWYDGYLFGDVNVYCPWDVLNYCDELLAKPGMKPKNYWAHTSGNGMVRRFIKKATRNTREDIERLLEGGSIVKPIRENLTYGELDASILNLWSVLYATGYLTTNHAEPTGDDACTLMIPNKEIRKLFAELVKELFQENALADTAKINRFCEAFPQGDVDTVQEMLNGYLRNAISVRDTAVRTEQKENFYHGMLLGLLQSQSTWTVMSNAEVGEGYCDIFIITSEDVGVVIELKYAHDGNLEKACKEALTQIEEKEYATGFEQEDVERIVKYGIAFRRKKCMVMAA